MEKFDFLLIVDSPQSCAHLFSVEKLFGRPIHVLLLKLYNFTVNSKVLYKKLVPNVRCTIFLQKLRWESAEKSNELDHH